jgi:sugar lactone lactonase YvrE
MAWDDTGSRLYLADFVGDTVYQYAITTDYDPSTQGSSKTLDVSGQTTDMEGITLAHDGNTLFLLEEPGGVFEYDLSITWDISTASFTQSLDVSGRLADASDIVFAESGSKMFLSDHGDNPVEQYSLSTAYDISTATHEKEYTTTAYQSVTGLAWDDTGDNLYLIGNNMIPNVIRLSADSQYDISNLTQEETVGVANGFDISWSGDGSSFFFPTGQNQTVIEYNADPGTTGDVRVDWSAPVDIVSWDIATFQESPDGETITYDIIQQDGTVLKNNISPGEDVSDIANDKNVAIKINFSRTNSSNSPKCDYLARRYVR